jgi:hypothetical protein
MKKQIKRWMIRLVATGLLIVSLLLIIVLNPIPTYANKTTHGHFSIYHNNPINPLFTHKLDQASVLLQSSTFFDSHLQLDVCINDGSIYPDIIQSIHGKAFACGFYNKVVMQANMNCEENFVELNGYKWNLVQLLAHETTHCLQYNQLGSLHSKPFAAIPN